MKGQAGARRSFEGARAVPAQSRAPRQKALVADLAPAERRGFAFGIYNAVTGLGALAASVIFGLIWNAYGTTAAFGFGAALALAATVLLFAIIDRSN